METNPEFSKYMNSYHDFKGLWDSPSRCGLKVINRTDGKMLVIVTELYRQNPGTAVTDCIASLATGLLKEFNVLPDNFIFIEHSPDLKSKLTFYGETFDLVRFEWDGNNFSNPVWTRLSHEVVDAMMME